MQTQISIVGMGSISPLGHERHEVWQSYLSEGLLLSNKAVSDTLFAVGALRTEALSQIALLQQESPLYSMPCMPPAKHSVKLVGLRTRTLVSI